MLRCADCGEVFDEVEMTIRHSFENGRTEHCPRCLSESIDEVKQCNLCLNWTTEYEMEEGLCPECAGLTMRTFRTFLNDIFTPEQIDYLSNSDCF